MRFTVDGGAADGARRCRRGAPHRAAAEGRREGREAVPSEAEAFEGPEGPDLPGQARGEGHLSARASVSEAWGSGRASALESGHRDRAPPRRTAGEHGAHTT